MTKYTHILNMLPFSLSRFSTVTHLLQYIDEFAISIARTILPFADAKAKERLAER